MTLESITQALRYEHERHNRDLCRIFNLCPNFKFIEGIHCGLCKTAGLDTPVIYLKPNNHPGFSKYVWEDYT